jgi:hypothetical protein
LYVGADLGVRPMRAHTWVRPYKTCYLKLRRCINSRICMACCRPAKAQRFTGGPDGGAAIRPAAAT